MQKDTNRIVYMLLGEIFNTATQDDSGGEHARGYIAGLASAAQLIMDADGSETENPEPSAHVSRQ